MLSMFSPNSHESRAESWDSRADERGHRRGSSSFSLTQQKILERLDDVVKAQTEQNQLMAALEERTSTLRSTGVERCHSRPTSLASMTQTMSTATDGSRNETHSITLKPASHPGHQLGRSRRKSSWTWDPQFQNELGSSFELLRTQTPTSKEDGVRTASEDSKADSPSNRTSDETTSGRSSLSATHRLRLRWAEVKKTNMALRLFLDKDGNFLRRVTKRQVSRARTALRASWLYRQRAAGRLKEIQKRTRLCSAQQSTACLLHVFGWLPIMPPTAIVSIIWDGLVRFALVYVATFTPMQTAFYRKFDAIPWHVVNLICELLFIFNPVVRFRRGFTHDGVYISDPVFITSHYMQGSFFTDAIAAFPYAWLLGVRLVPEAAGAPPRAAAERMLPLLRVVRIIVPLLRHLSTADQASSGHSRWLNPGVMHVMRAILILFFTCHCIGCVWWCVGELEQDGLLNSGNMTFTWRAGDRPIESWGPSRWLRETQPLPNQYAHAFLWGAGMMTGFVPTDVVPYSLPEVVVTILALFFGLVVNTAIISSTTSALQSISFKSSTFVHKMQNIHQYMRQKRVPHALANKIIGFYEYQLSPSRSGEGQNELSDLPPVLAMELIMHTHQDLFRDCPIFRLVPPPTALSLVECFEPVVFVPGEIVIHEGKRNAALYVINRGLVKVLRRDETEPSGHKTLTTLTDSDFFGEQTLLKTITSKSKGTPSIDCTANASCQCASYCDMFRLTSEDFMSVLEEARCRQASWDGKDVAGILNDAADERNMRANDSIRRRKRPLWACAGEQILRQNRQARARSRLGMQSGRSSSPFGVTARRRLMIRGAISFRKKDACVSPRPSPKLDDLIQAALSEGQQDDMNRSGQLSSLEEASTATLAEDPTLAA